MRPPALQHKHIARSVSFARGDSAWRLCTGGAEKLLRIFDLQRPEAAPLGAQPGALKGPTAAASPCLRACCRRRMCLWQTYAPHAAGAGGGWACAVWPPAASCLAGRQHPAVCCPAAQSWAPRPTTSASRTGSETTTCCWCHTSTSQTWSERARTACPSARAPAALAARRPLCSNGFAGRWSAPRAACCAHGRLCVGFRGWVVLEGARPARSRHPAAGANQPPCSTASPCSVWDVRTGAVVRSLESSGGAVTSIEVTPCGRYIVTADGKQVGCAVGICALAAEQRWGREMPCRQCRWQSRCGCWRSSCAERRRIPGAPPLRTAGGLPRCLHI